MVAANYGILYGYNCAMFAVEFNSAGKPTVHQIRREGKYLDMVVFKKKGVAYFYDDETESTYMYILKKDRFEVIMKGALELSQGKLIRKDIEERNLYIKTGKNDITIIFDILENPSFGQLEVQNPVGTEIQDFQIIGDRKILTLSNKGNVCIFTQTQTGVELSSEYNCPLLPSETATCCGASATQIAISTYSASSSPRIFLIAYPTLSLLSYHVFEGGYSSTPQFSALSFLPSSVLLLITKDTGILASFSTKNNRFDEFGLPSMICNGNVAKADEDGQGNVWTVDPYGLVVRINA